MVRFGDHAAFRGEYVGIVVDVDAAGDNVMIAHLRGPKRRRTSAPCAVMDDAVPFKAAALEPVPPPRQVEGDIR